MCSRTLPAPARAAAAARAQLPSQGPCRGMVSWHHLFICIINVAEAAGLLGNPTQSSRDEMARRAPAFPRLVKARLVADAPLWSYRGVVLPLPFIYHPPLTEQIALGSACLPPPGTGSHLAAAEQDPASSAQTRLQTPGIVTTSGAWGAARSWVTGWTQGFPWFSPR